MQLSHLISLETRVQRLLQFPLYQTIQEAVCDRKHRTKCVIHESFSQLFQYVSLQQCGDLNLITTIPKQNTVTGGPNSPLANGSLISGLESEIDYAYKCITKMQEENIVSMEPTEDAVKEFLIHRDALMKEMVWSSSCRSW